MTLSFSLTGFFWLKPQKWLNKADNKMGRRALGKKIKRHMAIRKIRKNGFWFVDIPRTSSSSIRVELGNQYGIVYGKNNLIEHEHSTNESPAFTDHITAEEMRGILGNKLWEKLFTFSVVRNPWDRIFSLYNYRLRIGELPNEMTFTDYVRALADYKHNPLFQYSEYTRSATTYITDEARNVIVDFVIKYENRERGLDYVGKQIGCANLGSLVVQKATPPDSHYKNHYDSETRGIIETLYADDIELFNYQFG